jgi:hypothetical protein
MDALEPRLLLAGEPWGAYSKLIRQDAAITHFPEITGRNQAVAVIGTGIDYNHPALGGGFGAGRKVVAGYDFADEDSDPLDVDGHDTGLAGIIAARDFTFGGFRYRGLAPDARLIALRTDNGVDRGDEFLSNVERALRWVIDHREQYNIVAVTMAFGGGRNTEPTTRDPYSDELATLHANDVFIAAASGNAGVRDPASIGFPAADPSVYAIGSVDVNGVISEFTSRNGMLDLLAPGNEVPTTYYDPGKRAHVYLAATGTSFATAFAAGAAALLRQADRSMTPTQIINTLKSTGIATFDGDNETGPTTGLTFSRLNIDAALDEVIEDPPPPAPDPEPENDDSRENNDSIAAATVLNWNAEDRAGASELILAANDADFFRFTINSASRVQFWIDAIGSPAFELYTSSGSFIASLSSESARDLAAGTYAIRVHSPTTLSGTYAVAIGRTGIAQPPPPAPNPSPTTRSGTWNDIAYDSRGVLHAAWYDPATRQLKYATRSTSGAWSSSRIVDFSPTAFAHVSLAVDSSDRPGIAYFDDAGDNLYYARWNGAGFSVRDVDRSGSTGQYASLAFDRKDNAAIVYYRQTTGDLRLATLKGKTAWSIASIDRSGDTGQYASVALDPGTRRLAVAYYSPSKRSFLFSQQTGTSLKSWRKTYVRVNAGGGPTSLAYDGKNAAFTFYDSSRADLLLAAHDGRKWGVTTVAGKGSQGDAHALLFDTKGRAHVYYHNQSMGSLVYARLSTGRWTYTTLASGGGAFVSADTSPRTGARSVLHRAGNGQLLLV